MLFNSFSFLLFLPIAALGYFLLPRKLSRVWLLAMSLYFYACWNAAYLALIVFSILITFLCGRVMASFDRKGGNDADKKRKLALAASFFINLSILFVFKYFNFFSYTLFDLFGKSAAAAPALDLLLPVGISFYTFQALGYTMDVYRRDVEAERNLIDYALFVSFFPQLVAGPIERTGNLLPQLKTRAPFSAENAKIGLLITAKGYFLKLVIADRAAVCVDAVYNNPDGATGLSYALATVLFAFQIYCDFFGYSTIALGCAKIMGIELMDNFERPYLSASISEFWRRWHISLSRWFRDYLYIPLGGNRVSKTRKYFNIMVVFLVSGLWHGANMTFVVWGSLHGLYQIIGDMLTPLRLKACSALHIDRDKGFFRGLRILITFGLTCLAWVFFRAKSLRQALIIIETMFSRSLFSLAGNTLPGLDTRELIVLAVALLLLIASSLIEERGVNLLGSLEKQCLPVRWAVYLILAYTVIIFGRYGASYSASAFIYFQF